MRARAHARELLALHMREPEALRAEVGVDFAERLFAAIKRRETWLDFHAQQAVTAGGGIKPAYDRKVAALGVDFEPVDGGDIQGVHDIGQHGGFNFDRALDLE